MLKPVWGPRETLGAVVRIHTAVILLYGWANGCSSPPSCRRTRGWNCLAWESRGTLPFPFSFLVTLMG